MPTSQEHVSSATPMGATLMAGGATFRVWAPRAAQVYVLTDELPASRVSGFQPAEKDLLVRRGDDTWAGFVPGLVDGSPYRFWVAGEDGGGLKRDPYARELGTYPAFPDCDCLIRSPDSYPWHDAGWRPPAARDLIIYQLHVGTYYGVDENGQDTREARSAGFLDILFRLEHLRDLGVTAVQLLPIQEYPSEFSMGYNGTDYFSPEMNYQVETDGALARYLVEANRLLDAVGAARLSLADLRPGPNQLKAVVDLCHLHGMAVLFDVVYNHAGGGFGDQSIYFFDRRRYRTQKDSLYFTDQGWAGGLVFDFSNPMVRRFLIDNAAFLLREYHVDGLRYDEVSVIDRYGGWSFAQELAGRVQPLDPARIHIAEYWNDWRWLAVTAPPGGLGFDAACSDRLQHAIRGAIRQASFGATAAVRMDEIAAALPAPPNFPSPAAAVHYIENHDIVYWDRPPEEFQPRIPALADPSDPRSWYARSRSRAALGLLLTAPGIPHLFMGQELLEDKNWSDNPRFFPGTLIWWDGLPLDRAMRDHFRYTSDLIALRRRLPALRSDRVAPFHVHNGNRVLAVHRWIEGRGEDVVIVANLRDVPWGAYEVGFPAGGTWRELFNSDWYDGWPNPGVVGNYGAIVANGPPLHGFAQSARLILPANAILVFARPS